MDSLCRNKSGIFETQAEAATYGHRRRVILHLRSFGGDLQVKFRVFFLFIVSDVLSDVFSLHEEEELNNAL